MKDTIVQFAVQYIVPLLLCAVWYLAAGALGSILGKWTTIESWVIANPKRALVYQILRATGLDFKKLLTSLKAFAEARSGFPPVIEVRASSEIVPDVGVVKTETTRRVSVKPLVASMLVLLAVSGCSMEAARYRRAAASPLEENVRMAKSARPAAWCQKVDNWHVGLEIGGGVVVAPIGAAAGIVAAADTSDKIEKAAIGVGLGALAVETAILAADGKLVSVWTEQGCGQ